MHPTLKIRPDRINQLAEINLAQRYLEIGVCRGNTFLYVGIKNKDAVDPKFLLDILPYSSETCRFFEMTSDDYFLGAQSSMQRYDIIFLDGLHTFEQVFRDFCASQSLAHDRTIWLIDDTVPVNLPSAHPDPSTFLKLRTLLNEQAGMWMGDVYKLVFAIHDFFPQFNYATFDGAHGQTVVWRSPRDSFAPHWNSLEKISRLEYADFLLNRELMNYSTDTEIFKAIHAGLTD